MCKYCDSHYNEDLTKELISKKIRLYVLEDKTLLDVSIDPEPKEMIVYLSSEDSIRKMAKVRIQYCPMCGRQL